MENIVGKEKTQFYPDVFQIVLSRGRKTPS